MTTWIADITDGRALIEPVAFVIVTVWLALRFRMEPTRADKLRLARELAAVAVAAWIGEDTCVRLYKFYAYASLWRVFVDVVPLAVVCIWPVVIRSALDLAHALAPVPPPASTRLRRTHIGVALLAGVLVCLDASLIEPIATHTGLWWWTEPGPFDVPIVGVLGWGMFAFGCVRFSLRPIIVVIAPLLLHAMLLASWWGLLRWLPRGTEELLFVAFAWAFSLALTALLVVKPRRIPRVHVLVRAPAAAFFFTLLALWCKNDLELVAYGAAFVPPWLALMATSARAP